MATSQNDDIDYSQQPLGHVQNTENWPLILPYNFSPAPTPIYPQQIGYGHAPQYPPQLQQPYGPSYSNPASLWPTQTWVQTVQPPGYNYLYNQSPQYYAPNYLPHNRLHGIPSWIHQALNPQQAFFGQNPPYGHSTAEERSQIQLPLPKPCEGVAPSLNPGLTSAEVRLAEAPNPPAALAPERSEPKAVDNQLTTLPHPGIIKNSALPPIPMPKSVCTHGDGKSQCGRCERIDQPSRPRKPTDKADRTRKLQSKRNVRVSTGCIDCKARKVNCDEVQPRCTQCAHDNLQCRWKKKATRLTKPQSEVLQNWYDKNKKHPYPNATQTKGLQRKPTAHIIK